MSKGTDIPSHLARLRDVVVHLPEVFHCGELRQALHAVLPVGARLGHLVLIRIEHRRSQNKAPPEQKMRGARGERNCR